ncbi:unnamed protein product [Staurois parvus]|uniref:Uncharacterized protein n=1 Tax=Staurois parvus TaxID=386267 RepID=A0ABN9GJB1_9NEOB|nr:unnamed protein product [Staurois parvus]
MYINGRTGAGQEQVAIYTRPPHSLPVRAPWEHSGTPITVWDLC